LKKNFILMPALVLGSCALALAQAPAAAPAAARPAAPAVAPTKIAIINVQQAIVNTKEGQKAAAGLQSKFNPRKTALEKRQNDITALQDQLKKGGATMSDVAKEKIMRDIDANTKSLNRDAEDLNADVEQEQSKIMQDLGNKLMAVLDQYAAQNGYAVVLDVSNQQSPVFWADASTVVTADIVKLYDQAHPWTAEAAKPAAPKPAAPAASKPAAPAAKKQ
jgi:outer membrane protein